MGVIKGLATRDGTSSPNFWCTIGNHGPLSASNLMSHQVFFTLPGIAMSTAAAWPQCLAFFGTPLVIEPSPGQLSDDAGVLPIRRCDQRVGLS
jgi:hypothetical protein